MKTTAFISFEAVREAADFPTVLSHYKLEPVGSAPQVKILCPFHDDDSPSCGVNYDKNNFHCFACKAGGNILDFVNLMEGGDKGNNDDRKKAAFVLADMIDYSPQEAPETAKKAKPATRPTKSKKSPKKAKSEPLTSAINEPLDLSLINMTLETDHPFFDAHGISEAMIETFGLGYTPVGIMKGRIVIPIHNANGEIVAFAGRYAESTVPDDVPRYKLPKNFHRSLELFNFHRARQFNSRHIVIVEGYWSTMRLHLAGIPTVATLGTSISSQQVELLLEHHYRYVTVIFDGDEEGQKGAISVNEQLSAAGLYTRRLNLPNGVKPDTMGDEWLKRLKP